MKLIYQIGRLDFNIERPLKFKIKDRIFKNTLSSFALKDYLKNSNSVLIYPVSLPFNKSLINSRYSLNLSEKLRKKIENIIEDSSSYFENPSLFFKEHPHTQKADDFILIHSIGEYENRKFKGNFGDIVLEIFLDMVERYLKISTVNKIYIDVSSGHNIYVSALLEATKHFSVFSQLLNWKNKDKIPEIFLVYSEPIQVSSSEEIEEKEYGIHLNKIQFKAFFSSPVKYEDIINQNSPEQIQYLENFALLFSGFKNIIPLSLYYFQHHFFSQIKDFLYGCIEQIKELLYKQWETSPSLNLDTYLKLFLSLGFYMGIMEVLESNNIKKSINGGIPLEGIKRNFIHICKYFDLNPHQDRLDREINRIKNQRKNIKENWKIFEKCLPSEKRRGNLTKRNFFAHLGFEKKVLQVKQDTRGGILVRWDLRIINKIKGYLIKEI